MDDALPADDVTGRTIGSYRVASLLGRGGMGAVYQAHDTNLNRPVALKVLPAAVAADADRLRRFRAEALAASSLNHPHILVIHDFGEVDGRPFIVTELVEGETLRQRLHRGPVAVREAVGIAMQIASALAAAHARGIVHRDIKPENVMLRPDGYVKVLDFGLAKLLTQAAPNQEPTVLGTIPGLVIGTPGYMSPEQARGLDVDARSDVWSVGVVLYELVSGRRPFGGATSADVMAAILSREPESLDRIVAKLPRALGEIVTKALTKDAAGRFASAHELHQSLTAARATIESGVDATPPPAGALMIDSLAVLPFTNAGGDPDTEYLSDGITESLINSLSQIPALRVVPRSSAFRYKARDVDPIEVGRQLKVSALVTGKVLHRGETLTIQAELVDVRHEPQQLWGERFGRKAADIFAVEEELARQIAGKLRGKLTGDEHDHLTRRYTDDTEAYHLYLKGRYHWNKRRRENLIKAVGYFEQAIARDGSYALPYAGLADAYLVLCFFDGGVPKALLAKGKTAALRALDNDPDLPEAHAALGLIEVCLDRAWPAAEQRYRRAIESNAAYWLTHDHFAFLLAAQGRFDEALSEVRRGLELEPLSLVVHHHVAWVSLFARRYDETIAICRKALEMEPNFSVAYVWMGIALEQLGEYDDAVAALESAAAGVNNSYSLAALAHVYAVSGRSEQARRRLGDLEALHASYIEPYGVALVHAGLGETDRALACLETAHRDHSCHFTLWAKVDPRLDVLRGEPRFQDLLQRAGLAKTR